MGAPAFYVGPNISFVSRLGLSVFIIGLSIGIPDFIFTIMKISKLVATAALVVFWQTTSPAAWRFLGLAGRQVVSLETHPVNSSLIIAGTDSGVYATTNLGQSWTPTTSTAVLASFIGYDPLRPDTTYLIWGGGSFSDGLYLSTNDGFGWSLVSFLAGPRRLAFDSANPGFFYVCLEDGILTTTDGGISFAPAGNGLPGTDILDIEGERINQLSAYAVGRNFVAATSNFGNNWNSLGGLFGMPAYAPYRLMQDRLKPETLYVSCKRYLARSTNDGVSWQYTPLPDSDYIALECDRYQTGRLFVGSAAGGGVLLSTDAGASFSQLSDGLGNPNIHSLRQAANGYLIAGTTDGVYLNDFGLDIGDGGAAPPTEISLMAYPNPFNGRVCLKYNPAAGSTALIEIYNINGVLIYLLQSESAEPPGMMFWNGCDMTGSPAASGIYLCRLHSGAISCTERVTLIK